MRLKLLQHVNCRSSLKVVRVDLTRHLLLAIFMLTSCSRNQTSKLIYDGHDAQYRCVGVYITLLREANLNTILR